MLAARDQVPHFTVRSIDGTEIRYDDLWQHKHLLLVLLDPERSGSAPYLDRLRDRMGELTAHETACVVTADTVAGAPSPGVLVADRWGEIWYVCAAGEDGGLPAPEALIEWLRYVQMQCPECQGETR